MIEVVDANIYLPQSPQILQPPKPLLTMQKAFKDFNLLQVFTFVILFGMAISAIIITRNVNEEFKIRELAGQLQKYKYATLSFNNIYNGLPGDLERASFYWQDETSDGNGDRKIIHEDREGVLAWQHLQLAGLIEAEVKFSGKWQSDKEGFLVANFNAPVETQHGGVYFFNYNEAGGYNYLGFGGATNKSGISEVAILTPEEILRLDLIIDDGYPETGNLKALSSEASKCFLSGEYKDEKELKECSLEFRI